MIGTFKKWGLPEQGWAQFGSQMNSCLEAVGGGFSSKLILTGRIQLLWLQDLGPVFLLPFSQRGALSS